MRLRSLLATTLLLGQVHTAFAACARPEDRTAFDLEGLKSELMVTALSCKDQDRYNAFMSRFHAEIMTDERALDAYFKRSYGRGAQHMHDDYITNLANVQSQDGLKAGTAFCENLPAMFDEVMSLHDSSELQDYISSKDIVQPVSFTACTGGEAVTHTSRHTRHAKKS